MTKELSYNDAVNFHGHSCPGLAIGFRIAAAARRELGGAFSADEEIMCVTENDSCSVDAVQVITGCTAGKGNLLIDNIGKQAFSFYCRKTGREMRIYYHRTAQDAEIAKQMSALSKIFPQSDEKRAKIAELRQSRIDGILAAPEAEILRIGPVQRAMPKEAQITNSAQCHHCGELTMETKLKPHGDKKLCPFCAGKHS